MNELPKNGHHTMRYTGLRSDYHELKCDICGRHVLIHSNPSSTEEGDQTFVILKRGDFWASHSGGIGGLVINGVEFKQDTAENSSTGPSTPPGIGSEQEQGEDEIELSDEWKGWLGDILDDVE